MAAHLSRLAKYHIADFVNHREVIMLPREWHEMYDLYHSGGIQRHRMPFPEYVLTKEFDLCLRKDVSATAVEYLFTDGPEATFWYKVPAGLLSSIVELFLHRHTATPLRPVLFVCDFSTPSATLLWQELYVSFFPCRHCERIQVGGDEEVGRRRPWNFHDPTLPEHIRRHNGIGWDEAMLAHVKQTSTYVNEVFHIKNPASGQEMTIELWFDSFSQSILERFAPLGTDSRVKKHLLRRVKIQLVGCTDLPLASLRLSSPTRRSKILRELMLEVYRFLPRYWLDASQLVCDESRHSIERAAEHLPLYPLTVDFKHTDVAREREVSLA
ncbi:hypothetical protein AAVH_25712 [Aphelenchoides avenae]|nr:hypothetical protein AAVH_25712 [Aphelenchus avenae]